MKLADIVNQLRTVLPKYTGVFSGSVSVSGISSSGGTATVTTSAPHGLVTGRAVTLSGFELRTPIIGVSIDGLVVTFTTGSDHDLTLNWQDTVRLEGFSDTSWNDTFPLVAVPNRRTFSVQTALSVPTLGGNEVLPEIRVDGINGQYGITVTGPSEFTISGDGIDGLYSGGTLSTGLRIAGVVDIDRALDQYTKQSIGDAWLYVTMRDAEVSRDRSTLSDAIATPTSGTEIRLRIMDGFRLYVVVNTTQDMTAVGAIDLARHTLLLPILKSLYGARFDSGLSGSGDFRTVFAGHGVASYNKAVYVHAYDFEVSSDLTGADAVELSDNRAFRDINYLQGTAGTESLEALIDLDDEPLAP